MRWWAFVTRQRFLQADTWLLELFLGIYTLVWGLNFANPLTDVFTGNPRAYVVLGQFPGGEGAFGVAVAILGAAALIVALWGHRQYRAYAVALVGIVWLVIAVAIGVPTKFAGGATLGLLALTHWYCMARLSQRGVG